MDSIFTAIGPDELSRLTFKREIRTDLYRPYLFLALRDLIVAREVFRLRRCPECQVFFFDDTKNGRKKYCNPTACGNRAKQRAFRRRLSAGKADGSVEANRENQSRTKES